MPSGFTTHRLNRNQAADHVSRAGWSLRLDSDRSYDFAKACIRISPVGKIEGAR